MFILLASYPQASGCTHMMPIGDYGRELLETVLKTCLNSSMKMKNVHCPLQVPAKISLMFLFLSLLSVYERCSGL